MKKPFVSITTVTIDGAVAVLKAKGRVWPESPPSGDSFAFEFALTEEEQVAFVAFTNQIKERIKRRFEGEE